MRSAVDRTGAVTRIGRMSLARQPDNPTIRQKLPKSGTLPAGRYVPLTVAVTTCRLWHRMLIGSTASAPSLRGIACHKRCSRS